MKRLQERRRAGRTAAMGQALCRLAGACCSRLSEQERLLAVPLFAALRMALLAVDVLATTCYGLCSRSCGAALFAGCEGLLSFTAVLNFFSVLAFAFVVLVRLNTEERAYGEALVVTLLLVWIDLFLKLGGMGTPLITIAVCFPDTLFPPFNSSLASKNCAEPCPVGDLYAIYGLYVLLKLAVGVIDVLLNTGMLLTKPRDWYRTRHGALHSS